MAALRRQRWRGMLPVVAALDLLGVHASAQPVDPRRRRATAEAAFRAAMQAWREGDYNRALEGFRRAQELLPHPATLFNVARAEERVGHIGAALDAYEEYLRLAPAASDAADVRRIIARLRPASAVVTAATPPLVTPPLVTPPLVTPPPTSYERIVDRRRHRLLSFRVGFIAGFAAPRDRQNLAVGFEATMFIGRSLTLLAHGLAIDTDGAPQVWTGEIGWTFVGDDFDLAVLAHVGALRNCDAICRGREGALDAATVFLGGLTLKVDVLFHPRISAGLYGRFSWQELNLLDGAALLSSIGLSVSLHL